MTHVSDRRQKDRAQLSRVLAIQLGFLSFLHVVSVYWLPGQVMTSRHLEENVSNKISKDTPTGEGEILAE